MLRRVTAVLVLAIATVAVFSCGDGDEPDRTSGPIGVYTGRIVGSDASIGITMGKAHILAWVCDGAKGIALQFSTPRLGDGFDVSLPIGFRLAGQLVGETLEGTLSGSAGASSFRAELAREQAGVWTATETVDGGEQRAVWIVLPDGSQQGASITPSGIGSAPRLDTGSGLAGGVRATRSNPVGGSAVAGQPTFGGGLSGGLQSGAGFQFGQFGLQGN